MRLPGECFRMVRRAGSQPTTSLWWLLLVFIPLPLTIWIASVALYSPTSPDWTVITEAGRRAWAGQAVYATGADYIYRYSPLFAYMTPVIAYFGPTLWRSLHIAAAAALPTWPLRLMVLASFAFWADLQEGNVMIFLLLLIIYAMRGSDAASVGVLISALLIPRPLMFPVVIWLLWRHEKLRPIFALLFAIDLLLTIASGYGVDWISVLITAGSPAADPLNLSPSRFMGLAWLLVGGPLAAYLTCRGSVGLAGLAISPYLLPYHMLIGLSDSPSAKKWVRSCHADEAKLGGMSSSI